MIVKIQILMLDDFKPRLRRHQCNKPPAHAILKDGQSTTSYQSKATTAMPIRLLNYVTRKMTTPDGGFYSAENADS